MKRVCVLGGGPVGLEFAASAIKQGMAVTVFERGVTIADNVRNWGHVVLFSPWKLNMSADGQALLTETGVPIPNPEEFPTGNQLVEQYLQPMTAALQKSDHFKIHLATDVVSVTRGNLLKREEIGSKNRAATPYRLLVRDTQTQEERYEGDFDVVIDACGTYGNGNPIGPGGGPALGERALQQSGRLLRVIPDVLGRDRARFAGKTTAIIGTGYSAITTIKNLELLAAEGEKVKVLWIARKAQTPYKRIENDVLPNRDLLSAFGNDLSAGQAQTNPNFDLEFHGGCHIVKTSLVGEGVQLELESEGQTKTVSCDFVVSQVGYRPDLEMFRELQIHQCYATEGPIKLAASLLAADGAGGDCLSQAVAGPNTLLNPEPGFFVLGMKSYGRSSLFIMHVGHQQVQHVIQLLTEA